VIALAHFQELCNSNETYLQCLLYTNYLEVVNMKKMKQLLASLLVVVFACGMLTSGVMAEEAAPADAVPAAEPAAEPEVKADPIEGSWVLSEVYEVKANEAPVLLKKEENQSLYGSGVGVYTFDADGFAHHNTIDGTDNMDAEASWQNVGPNVYSFTEGSDITTFQYIEKEDSLHRSFAEEGRNLNFVYTRGMVGSWKLDKVVEIHEGDASVDLPKEENQSLYGSGESVLIFESNGNASDEVTDGPDKVVKEGSWKLTGPDQFTYTEDTMEMEFSYFRVDDTIFRDFKDDAPDAPHAHLHFIYVRVNPQPAEAEQETTKAAQAETKAAAQPAAQPATQAAPQQETTTEAELIADGQIFTGRSLTLYNPDNRSDFIVVDELNQGGWADQSTGKIYYQGAGGSLLFTADDDSTWVLPEYFAANEEVTEEEVINDGQIFTGTEMNLYDPNTGELVIVKELSQGGFANEATGEIFTQESGGGDHFYGDQGTMLVTEWLFLNSENIDTVVDDTVVDDTVVDDTVVDDTVVDDTVVDDTVVDDTVVDDTVVDDTVVDDVVE